MHKEFKLGEHVHFCEPEGLPWVGSVIEIKGNGKYAAKDLFSNDVIDNYKQGSGSFAPTLKIIHTDSLHSWTPYSPSNGTEISQMMALSLTMEQLRMENGIQQIDFCTFQGPDLYVNWSIIEVEEFLAKIHSFYQTSRYDGTTPFGWEYAAFDKWGDKLLP